MIRHIQKMSERSALLLLALLLIVDIGFMVLHVIIGIFDPNPALCNISGICAYMNVYHLVKLFWVCLLLLYILKLTKCSGYASWALLFACFFIDDALWLHQKIGDRITPVLNASFFQGLGLQSREYELAVLGIAWLVLLSFVAWPYFHGTASFRKVSIDIFLFLAALVFFGLIVDMAEAIGLGSILIFALGFVEDGGELIVYSILVWYLFQLALKDGKQELFLYNLFTRS
jgi:hypothetical protein